MAEYVIETVFTSHDVVGEGPVWDAETGTLYWVDIPAGAIHRWVAATGEHERYEVGLAVGAMALRANGAGFVLATARGYALWSPDAPTLESLADPEADRPRNRFNDGKVDSHGRFWAGTMGNEAERDGPVGNLYRLDPDHRVRLMDSDIVVSNGLGWNLDDTLMYYTDSDRRVIYTYDFDAATGEIGPRRVFIETPPDAGVPDGMTVDAEGCIWSACWDGGRIIRYTPDGKIERQIEMPVRRPTSCAFGGPDLMDLYVTSAWATARDEQRDGNVFRLRLGIRGRPQHRYRG